MENTSNKKRGRGRPALYQTPEEMQKKIDEYFLSCLPKAGTGPNGDPVVIPGKAPTITSLSLYLGFTSRHSFYNSKRRPGFSKVYDMARARLEAATEERLFSSESYQGAVFSLINNFGWKHDDVMKRRSAIGVKIVNAPRKESELQQSETAGAIIESIQEGTAVDLERVKSSSLLIPLD